MATYYVYSAAGGSNTGGSWTNAFLTFAQAVSAANADGDVIKVHYTHQDELSSDTTYTLTNNVAVICVNKDSSDAPTAMGTSGWLGKSVTTSYNVFLAASAGKTAYVFGITLRNTAALNRSVGAATANDSHIIMESPYFWLGTTSASARIMLGAAAAGAISTVDLINPTFRFGATGQNIAVSTRCRISGGAISADGSAPTSVFSELIGGRQGAVVSVYGLDASVAGSATLVGDFDEVVGAFTFSNCKLGASFVALGTQTIGQAGAEVTLYNCDSGNVHYAFGYYNALGSCVAYTAIRANDAPTYDGTNGFSWRIDTSASASFYTPFITPWISTYHDGTSAITLSLEGLISSSSDTDSGTQLQDDEVWGEFSVQNNTGSTLASISSDRMALLGTAADQTSAKGAGDWTGEQTYFSTFKCASASVTPAVIGELRARLCVGFDTSTRGSIYLDPQIRAA